MKTLSFQPAVAFDAPKEGLRTAALPLPAVAGFFFAFRFALTFLFFQSDPRSGTIVSLCISGILVFSVLVARAGEFHFSMRGLVSNRILRWLLLYLLASGASLLWTLAESPAIAAGYWSGMVMDVLIVILLLSCVDAGSSTYSMLAGFVTGSLFVAAVAWLSPTLPDMRIGNEEFLHPNGLGLMFALAFLIAQHLAAEKPIYSAVAIVLAISVMRTLSKTSIIALVITEAIYLLSTRRISRPAKLRIAALTAASFASFSRLVLAYADLYANEGNAPETLTGRTAIWATSIIMSLEHPWIGHGLYSFRALVPAFGSFEPWHAHNEFLQQFFELGLVGVLLTASLYFALFRSARRHRSSCTAETAILLVIFSMLHGLTDTVNFGLSLPLWLFTLFAFGLSPGSVATQEET